MPAVSYTAVSVPVWPPSHDDFAVWQSRGLLKDRLDKSPGFFEVIGGGTCARLVFRLNLWLRRYSGGHHLNVERSSPATLAL